MEKRLINNHFYEEVGHRWYEGEDHPIALLRAENRARAPWILQTLEEEGYTSCHILDIACGGGLLSNQLAVAGHHVTGIDLSRSSLEVAKKNDKTDSVKYIEGDALSLPFDDQTFDVVLAMDFLEHVDNPLHAIAEASRVCKEGGLFFFHTFNRNWYSYFLAIKGVEWFVQNTPKDFHVYQQFIKPAELQRFLSQNKFTTATFFGLRPRCDLAFFKMLLTRKVPFSFTFEFCSSLKGGYLGYSQLKSK